METMGKDRQRREPAERWGKVRHSWRNKGNHGKKASKATTSKKVEKYGTTLKEKQREQSGNKATQVTISKKAGK